MSFARTVKLPTQTCESAAGNNEWQLVATIKIAACARFYWAGSHFVNESSAERKSLPCPPRSRHFVHANCPATAPCSETGACAPATWRANAATRPRAPARAPDPAPYPARCKRSVMRMVICSPRQNSSAYSEMMSARNQPNQRTCAMEGW